MTGRGGPRPGAGRKRLTPEEGLTRPLTVWVTEPQAERLRELGDGNASAGVRRLLEENRGLRALLVSPYQGEYRYVSDQAIDEALAATRSH